MTSDDAALDDARRELYAGPRATFVERRKELADAARRAGDPEHAKLIGKLRKPAAAAHVVNLLAQSDDAALGELVELGAKIRQAMAEGDDSQLRTLLRARSDAIAKTVAAARAVARSSGEPVSGAVGDQIVQTLRAAMSSDDAAAGVRSGTLTDPLDEPGFEGFDAPPATRAPSRRGTRTGTARSEPEHDAEHDAERDAARESARAAARARVRSATAAVARAEQALAAITKRRDGLSRDRDRLAAELARAEAELAAEEEQVEGAAAELSAATAELETAREAGPD